MRGIPVRTLFGAGVLIKNETHVQTDLVLYMGFFYACHTNHKTN